MIKAIVVDDEVLTAEHICRLLGNSEVEVLGYYSNPYEALGKVKALKPDVLFLDIEMPEMSGLELAEKVHAAGHDGEIVFITAYNQYAIEAFSVNALDYLLKPVTAEGLDRAVERVKKRRIAVPVNTAKSSSNKIRVSLFGSLYLYIGDEKEPIRWMTAKCAEVFAFMLLQKGEVSKWKLIEAIWPDKDKEKADINLRSTISRLNKTFRENAAGMSMISIGNGYQLISKDMELELEVDAFKLEKLVLDSTEIDSANAEYCDSVIESYRGMFLEESESEWCDDRRVSYHRYFISAAKKLVKYYERVYTEPLKILNIVELLIKYEPYDEEIRKEALKLHYRLGGRQSAVKYYGQYRALLKKELGIEPGESMQRVYASLIKP